MRVGKDVSTTLAVANLLAMILILSIHYNSKGMIDISHGLTWNYIIQEFISNGIARVAVPFFALTSGFFMYKRTGSFKDYAVTLKKKIKTLLLPYLIGSGLLLMMVVLIVFVSPSKKLDPLTVEWLVTTFFLHPVSIQYWFLRDLIIVTLVSPILFAGRESVNYMFGVFLGVLWFLNIQPLPTLSGWYLINIEVLFFFWLGGVLYAKGDILDVIIGSKNLIKFAVFCCFLLLLLVRIFIDPYLDVWYVNDYDIQSVLLYKGAIFLGVVSLIQIAAIFHKSQWLLYFSGFTFFVYLFHLAPITYVLHVLPDDLRESEFSFYINFPLATVIVFSLAYMVSKYFTAFFEFITGGRTPEKVIKRLDEH